MDDLTTERLRRLAVELSSSDRAPHHAAVDAVTILGPQRMRYLPSPEPGAPAVLLVQPLEDDGSRHPSLSSLSRREREVTALVAEGCTNRQIANRLFLSLATVKDHVHNCLRKTGSVNRTELAALWNRRAS